MLRPQNERRLKEANWPSGMNGKQRRATRRRRTGNWECNQPEMK
jgi:hypothetical protein